MKLNLKDIKAFKNAGFALPRFDIKTCAELTKKNPVWLHFGAGNIFRGFIASLQQKLLDDGLSDCGIIAAEGYDTEIIERIYTPYDNLVINVILNPDGAADYSINASITEAVDAALNKDRLVEIAVSPSLQIISFTITEKGYAIRNIGDCLMPIVITDMRNEPCHAAHIMSVITYLCWRRYQAGGRSLALVSMDNCAKNGDILKDSISQIAWAWRENGYINDNFLEWLADETNVSFPLSMIDKITPSPAAVITDKLKNLGIEGIDPIKTAKSTYIAPFVNAEAPQYLVIEDKFPNGRPPLERAGVYFTDRATVNKTERMKVTACLNPLHSAMAPFGCLLGFKSISDEMKDAGLTALVKRIGYDEGLPVVPDPKILSPKAFIDEVVNIRLPNPFIPDTPQRIMTDHSQKVSVRFGETIKSYISRDIDLNTLTAIPLAVAAWFRYLLAFDDNGYAIELSTDPLLDELQDILKDIIWNKPNSHNGQINDILNNTAIFALDITKTPLAGRINEMFNQMLEGCGSVRKALRKYIGG